MSVANRDTIAQTIIVAGVTIGTVSALLVVLGADLKIGQVIKLLAVLLVLGLLTRRTVDLSVGFTIISIALLALLAEFVLPGFIVRPFSFVGEFFQLTVGLDISRIDPVNLFILAVVFVAVMISVRLRVTGEAKSPSTIIDRVLRKYARFVNIYLSTGRLLLLFVVSMVVLLFQNTGEFLGEVGNLAADSPFVVSNIVVAIAGFLSLGGELPVIVTLPLIGDLDAAEFAALVLVAVALAAAVKFESSGPLARFIRK